MGHRMAVMGVVVLALVAAVSCTSSDQAAGDGAGTTSVPASTASSTTTTPTTTTPPGPVFPGAEWATIDAATAGLDQAVLDQVAATADTADSNCLVVTRKGELVGEWYWNDTTAESTQEVFSASKSVTSTLVGIASDDGDLTVDELATDFIPEWIGTPSAGITVRNLLSNDSGRHHTLATDYVEMAARAVDKTGFSIGLGQDAEPGTTWVYNNAAIQTLDRVLEQVTGQDPAAFAADRLFGPIGMADTTIAHDRAGNTLTFMGVQSTCRDMARFGYLMLRHGDWGGDQIVSESWVAQATGAASQPLNSGYGWLWWLNRPGPVLGAEQASGGTESEPADHLVPGAPEDMFFALGLGGQIVAVDPTSETVVVRLGPSSVGEPAGTPKFGARDAAVVAMTAVVP